MNKTIERSTISTLAQNFLLCFVHYENQELDQTLAQARRMSAMRAAIAASRLVGERQEWADGRMGCVGELNLYRKFSRRIDCVQYALVSSPIKVTQSRPIRAYWRVEM